jgi:hypothetical protein
MNELSELARQGKMTGEEQAELDSYIHVGTSSPSYSLKGAAPCGVRLNSQTYCTPISSVGSVSGRSVAVRNSRTSASAFEWSEPRRTCS